MSKTKIPDLGLQFNRASAPRGKSDMTQVLDGISEFAQMAIIPLNILLHVKKRDGGYYDQSDLDRAMIKNGWMEEYPADAVQTNPWDALPQEVAFVTKREKDSRGLTGSWDKTQNAGGTTGGDPDIPERAPNLSSPLPAPGSGRS